MSGINVDNVDTFARSIALVRPRPEQVLSLVRDAVVLINKVVNSQTELFQIIRALHTSRRLNRRQEQSNENTDNRDNDQKFY